MASELMSGGRMGLDDDGELFLWRLHARNRGMNSVRAKERARSLFRLQMTRRG